jgi:hypothetical protein
MEQEALNQLGINVGKIGGAIGAVVAGVGAGWLYFKRLVGQGKIATAEKALAVSQETLYSQLTQRLNSLEEDYKSIREELRVERDNSRKLAMQNQRLELHIIKLEALMRNAGIEVPAPHGYAEGIS